MKVDNYFPYEKKLRRNNEDESENTNIYNILKKLIELNEKLEGSVWYELPRYSVWSTLVYDMIQPGILYDHIVYPGGSYP